MPLVAPTFYFRRFAIVRKAACAFDPFVEVSQVDDFVATFGHFIKEPLPQFSSGGGESILYAEFVVFSCPVIHLDADEE